jgi:hypothetical protein
MCPSQEIATEKFPGYDIRGSGQYAVFCAVSKVVELFFMEESAKNRLKQGCKHGAEHQLIYIPLPPAPKNERYGFDSHI